MYIKIFIITFSIFNFSLSFSQKEAKNNYFELNGTFTKSIPIKKIFISYLNSKDIMVKDSIEIIDNEFTINGIIDFPTQLFICKNRNYRYSENEYANVYIEPKKMKLTLNPSNFSILEFTGSKSQIEFSKLNGLKKNFYEAQKSTYLLAKSYYEQIQKSKDSIFIKEIEKKSDELAEVREKNNKEEFKINLKFAKENLKSFIVPYLLNFSFNSNNDANSFKKINTIYEKLDNSVKKSPDGLKLGKTLFNKKNSGIGSKAPNFSLKDINGNLVSLEKLKGKCVLIDFWASWCAPCRADFPFVKDIYNKNNKNGFEVISMGYMDKVDSWKKAIVKENTESWINISIEENKSETAKEYFVTAIPAKILIDKNGIIIGRWIGQSENTINEIQKKLNEIFEKK